MQQSAPRNVCQPCTRNIRETQLLTPPLWGKKFRGLTTKKFFKFSWPFRSQLIIGLWRQRLLGSCRRGDARRLLPNEGLSSDNPGVLPGSASSRIVVVVDLCAVSRMDLSKSHARWDYRSQNIWQCQASISGRDNELVQNKRHTMDHRTFMKRYLGFRRIVAAATW